MTEQQEATTTPSSKKPRKPRRPTVSSDTFVRVWQMSDTLEDVCEQLGMRRASASQRASNMRRRGIPLKAMPRNPNTHSVRDLQTLAATLQVESDVEQRAREKALQATAQRLQQSPAD